MQVNFFMPKNREWVCKITRNARDHPLQLRVLGQMAQLQVNPFKKTNFQEAGSANIAQ
jgi:hypothetical protein